MKTTKTSAAKVLDRRKNFRLIQGKKAGNFKNLQLEVDSLWLRNILSIQEDVRSLVTLLYNPQLDTGLSKTVQAGTTQISRDQLHSYIMSCCDKIIVNVDALNQ